MLLRYYNNSSFSATEFNNWRSWFAYIEDSAVPFDYRFYDSYYSVFNNFYSSYYNDLYKRVNWFIDYMSNYLEDKDIILLCDAIATDSLLTIPYSDGVYKVIPYKRGNNALPFQDIYKYYCPDSSDVNPTEALYCVLCHLNDSLTLMSTCLKFFSKFNRKFTDIFHSVDIDYPLRLFIALLYFDVKKFGVRSMLSVFDTIESYTLFNDEFCNALVNCKLDCIKTFDSSTIVSYFVQFKNTIYKFEFEITQIESFKCLGDGFDVPMNAFIDLSVHSVPYGFKLVD